MIARLNPLYIIISFLTITCVLVVVVQEKKEILSISNNKVSTFHTNLNEYNFLKKYEFSKNSTIDKVKSIIAELPNNINVKTLNEHIEVSINGKEEELLEYLNMFFQSNVSIKEFYMSEKNILIKVEI